MPEAHSSPENHGYAWESMRKHGNPLKIRYILDPADAARTDIFTYNKSPTLQAVIICFLDLEV